jgi:hypothetical protein
MHVWWMSKPALAVPNVLGGERWKNREEISPWRAQIGANDDTWLRGRLARGGRIFDLYWRLAGRRRRWRRIATRRLLRIGIALGWLLRSGLLRRRLLPRFLDGSGLGLAAGRRRVRHLGRISHEWCTSARPIVPFPSLAASPRMVFVR